MARRKPCGIEETLKPRILSFPNKSFPNKMRMRRTQPMAVSSGDILMALTDLKIKAARPTPSASN